MSIDVYANADALDVVFGDAGPPGQNAETGVYFSFSGQLQFNEPPQPGWMPTAGTFSAANSGGSWIDPPTGVTVWPVFMRASLSGVYAPFATATVSPAGIAWSFAVNAYPASAHFKCDPPAIPDPTMTGLVLVMAGP